jgi:hypothetical protein
MLRTSVDLPWLVLFPSLVVFGCGDEGATAIDAGHDAGPDAVVTCQPQGATGQFIKRAGNPRMLAGQAFTDGKIDISISDPDVRWNDGSQVWELYYATSHAASFGDPDKTQMIRHATSPDRMTWSVDDAPALAAAADVNAWDHVNTEAPTVVFNPDAPAERRYLLLYSGAKATFPHPGYAFPDSAIGAAFSADGITFTRVPASESPHGQDGLVLTGLDVYPIAVGAIVADPEVAVVNGVYHLFFSSFACKGTSCATVEAYGIAHATSADGIHWQVAEAPVRSLLRASADLETGGGQPSVIYDATRCRWEMWLTSDLPAEHDNQPINFNNMAGVWHADSSDGVAWHINYAFARELSWGATESGEHLGMLTGADVADKGYGRLMLYVGFDDQNVPSGFVLPDRTGTGVRAGVMTLDVATRDLP